ncbi:MAG: CYTH domain-containing protein [Nanoarchaeota archaeon]|nr:CYTH domain-containing protein [Nanoarchaeota archaeon]
MKTDSQTQNIEVEIRSFIEKKKYEELIEFFKKEGKFLGEDYQETYYFDCEQDLRIQKNNSGCKLWLKKGKIHDDSREEHEVQCKREDFEKLEALLIALGYNVEIKWFRKRHRFDWNGIKVTVDYTKGYGYILELEIMSNEESKKETLELLREKLLSLEIEETPKEEFNVKYEEYKQNWKLRTKSA